jgi:hypothetical protein
MSENAIDSKPMPDTAKPKGTRKPTKKAKPAKKAARAKKAAAKPKTERSNKKAEVIAMMKRAKGATLPEIMKATDWQPHTVPGFVSILGSKGRREDRVVQERGRANERTRSGNSSRQLGLQTPPRPRATATPGVSRTSSRPFISFRLFGLIPFDSICCLGLGGKLIV